MEVYRLCGKVPPFPAHFHHAYLLGLVVEGKRRLFLKRETRTLSPGDILLLAPGEPHACGAASGEELDFRGFCVPESSMHRWMEEAGFAGEGSLFFSAPVVKDCRLFCILHALHHVLMGEEATVRHRGKLLQLTAARLRRHTREARATEPEEKKKTSLSREQVESSCAYMSTHLTEPLTLESLSHRAGMSRASLMRHFAEEKGVTPRRYLEALRVESARRCLQHGWALVDVAELLGFADQSHFSRRFRKLTGFAPGHYRKLHERKEGHRAL